MSLWLTAGLSDELASWFMRTVLRRAKPGRLQKVITSQVRPKLDINCNLSNHNHLNQNLNKNSIVKGSKMKRGNR